MITAGEKLNQAELCKRINCGTTTFKTKRDQIIQKLADCCDYEIETIGRANIYSFYTDCDYDYKLDKYTSKTKKEKVIGKAILETLQEKPLNTAKNVARYINSPEKPEVKKLGYTDGTMYEKVKPKMKEWFGTKTPEEEGAFVDRSNRKGFIMEKVWCRKNSIDTYAELPPLVVEDFMMMCRNHFRQKDYLNADICGDYDSGLISKEQRDEELGELTWSLYTAAKKEFKDKYGFFPIKVAKYQVSEGALEEYLKENKEFL